MRRVVDISRRGRRPRRPIINTQSGILSFRVSEATRNLITTKPEFCHSEHRRCEESLLLYKHKLFLRCAGVTFGAKSNQKRGGCDSPAPHKRRTSVECSVCYKSGKITNLIHFVPSHCNFSSIYTSISPPVSIAVLCYPGSLLVLRRLRYCYSGKVFPRTPFCSQNSNLSNYL